MMELGIFKSDVFRENYCLFVLAHADLLCGAVFAYSAILLPKLLTRGKCRNPADFLIGPIVPFVATFGILLIAKQMESFGRKPNLHITFVLFAVGWFSLAMAPHILSLCISLAILAFTMNLSKTVTVLYKSEIISGQRKTSAVATIPTSSHYLFFTFGTTLDYVLNYFFEWRIIAVIYGTLSIIGMIQSCIIPETPYWHLSRGKPVNVKRSLTWLRPTTSVKHDELFYRIKADQMSFENDAFKRKSSTWIFNDMTRKKYLKGLIVGVVLCALRSGCGRDIFTMFTVNIFTFLKCHSIDPKLLAVGYGVFELVGCVIAQTQICDVRKKNMLYFSSSILIITLATSIMCRHVSLPFLDRDSIPWIIVTCLYVYALIVTSAYVYGLDSLAYQVQFPSKKEGMILVLSSVSYFCCFAYVTLFVTFEHADISLDIAFFYFICNVAVSVLVVYFFVPDTTNKEFSEVWNQL